MNQFTYQVYLNPKDFPAGWNQIASRDSFLTKEYLSAAYLAKPKNFAFYFVGVFQEEQLIGVAFFQQLFLHGKEMFRERPRTTFKEKCKFFLASPLKGNLLILGNMLHTGEHAYVFDSNKITDTLMRKVLEDANKEITKLCKKDKHKIHVELKKDFFLSTEILNQNQDFHEISIQPNMILEIRNHWKSLDDYLADMSTKYRTRYKRARKKFDGIQVKELGLDVLTKNQSRIYELYKCVSDGAGFNTFLLPENTFTVLKQELGNQVKIFGLFLDENLVGFYTLIHNNKVLEAYFLGYDSELQRNKQLYLNMLYNMVDYGITHQFNQIVLARTAMEIKSSIGAEPHDMKILIRHKSPFLNRRFKGLFQSLEPNDDWVQRKPFKENHIKKERVG